MRIQNQKENGCYKGETMKKINILGSEWTIEIKRREDDENLGSIDGYTDTSIKTIVVEDMQQGEGSKASLAEYTKQVIRHELIHAFLFESGLEANSFSTECWAMNEEMVDWLAIQSPKIFRAFEEADAL